jgi:hypothetical protein
VDLEGIEMRKLQNLFVLLVILACASAASAQRTEVTITLNEQFFDALLDAVFQNAGAPEFPLTSQSSTSTVGIGSSYLPAASECNESIRLLREGSGVRTAVRFREGKIYAPLAFDGNYNPPFIGCVNFAGLAEANIDLEFDQAGQRLIAKANVYNVSLNGTGGVGGAVIAKMVQGSIDRKINPIEIIRLDKLSFPLPLKSDASVKMKAVVIKHEITNGSLVIHILYEFVKG